MELQDSTTSKTVLVLTLPSGKQAKLIFHYDQEMISFLGAKSECYTMDELCFYFELNQLNYNYKPTLSTVFLIECGEHTLEWTETKSEVARLRIGPFLGQLFQEETFSNLGLDRGLDVDYTVTIKVSNVERDFGEDVYHDITSIVKECGSRGIRTSRDFLVPSEVAALYSSYFFNLFYGGFKDSSEKFIQIQDIDVPTILETIALCVLSRNREIHSNYQETHDSMLNLLEHSDRFAFTEIFNLLQDSVVGDVRLLVKITGNELQYIQDSAVLVRKHDLLAELANKFCILECIEKFEEIYGNEVCPELAARIAERKKELRLLSDKRPLFHLHYQAGTITVALIEELKPILFNRIIDFVKNGPQPSTDPIDERHETNGIFLTKQTYLVFSNKGIMLKEMADSDDRLAGVLVPGSADWQNREGDRILECPIKISLESR